jgi:hypothetical protein
VTMDIFIFWDVTLISLVSTGLHGVTSQTILQFILKHCPTLPSSGLFLCIQTSEAKATQNYQLQMSKDRVGAIKPRLRGTSYNERIKHTTMTQAESSLRNVIGLWITFRKLTILLTYHCHELLDFKVIRACFSHQLVPTRQL